MSEYGNDKPKPQTDGDEKKPQSKPTDTNADKRADEDADPKEQ